MTLQTIDPVAAKRLIDSGALLIDIREPHEHVRERVPGAYNAPLSRLQSLPADATTIIFHCRSGARTSSNAARLAAAVGCEAYILDGGIGAWKKAGLPVVVDRGKPRGLGRLLDLMPWNRRGRSQAAV
jgi:rhodanese-related sulfurtransferase